MIDLHLHSGWTDFFLEEQEKRSPEEIRARIETFWQSMKKRGSFYHGMQEDLKGQTGTSSAVQAWSSRTIIRIGNS